MAYGINKRACRRFAIPDASVKYRKTGLLVFGKGFSDPHPIENISKGGLAFICDKKFPKGKRLLLQFFAPDETPLFLHSVVRRQHPIIGKKKITGVEFLPFGYRRGWNSRETLDVLRRLEKKYGADTS